jgi:hypothetical protein
MEQGEIRWKSAENCGGMKEVILAALTRQPARSMAGCGEVTAEMLSELRQQVTFHCVLS